MNLPQSVTSMLVTGPAVSSVFTTLSVRVSSTLRAGRKDGRVTKGG